MSYNIDSTEYLKGKLFITRKVARMAQEEYVDDLPESNLLDGLKLDSKLPDDDVLEIKSPWWSGTGSGHSYDEVLPAILALTTGTADIMFTWEGGDSVTGLRVVEGKVSKKKVKQSLED